MPGLNWAIGLDGLRVLEATPAVAPGVAPMLDWLISIDAEEEEDMIDRMECGVQGEHFRLGHQKQSELTIERIRSGTTLVLPEACRVAAATDGVMPCDV